jgi:hypothetical protein
MNAPRYVQIDTAIFANPRVGILLRKHGAAGLGVFVYYLVELGRQADDVNVSIDADSVFCEGAACALGIDIDDFNVITSELLRIGLLCSDGGRIFSAGFNKRTGKEILANIKRSETLKSKTTPEPDPKPKTKSINPMKRLPTQEIIECWNAHAKSLRCMKATNAIEKAIVKLCKEYSLEEIQQSIENYHSVLNDPACFFSYKWNLGEFLSRANGFPVFYGDRDEIIGKYRKSGGKNANPEQPKTRKELLEAYK